jgi:eukaryotic-like serine/threonine-protein kinase
MTPSASPEDLFLAALDRPPADRAAFLEAACTGDPDRLRRVRELLAAHDQSRGPLDAPAVAGPTAEWPPPEAPGTAVGPYKLVEVIGEGGMGTVYLARQQEPVHRLVALKVIKAGMDSKGVLARFEAERQALAIMDHPNIARVLDAGATPDGRPYFVMELVKGTPITRYCDDHHLTPRQRLELFVPVCQAVQHAHQKGIIHRDLKPSNVLVAPYDGAPVPKVIDFGVAKAAGVPLTDKTLVTGLGAVVGTPEYMSPEQAELNNRDIDTRSDVYSLGVLLYELLTGTTPLTTKRVKDAALLEVLRVIREEDPPRPSTRLSESKDSLPSISAQRQTEPARLTKLVRGELDWIVMKALEKDRGRRYETATGLAADVQRHLAGEAVQAVPPTTWYRLRKVVRRHKTAVLVGTVLVLTLVAGAIGTALGFVKAVAERNEKEKSADAERAAKELAQARLEQVEKANDILAALFQKLDPHRARQDQGLRAQLARHVDEAARLLTGDLIGDPVMVARLQHRLGLSQVHLGYPERGIGLLDRAGETRKAHLGHDNPDTLNTLHCLAEAYEAAGQRGRALKLHEQVVERRRATLGPDHVDTLTSCNCLAACYQDDGQLGKALPLLEQAYERLQRDPGPVPGLLPAVMSNLARGYMADDRLDKAVPLLEAALGKLKADPGPDHPDTLGVMNNLAVAYSMTNRPKVAVPLLEQVLATVKAQLGPDHAHTLICMDNLGAAYRDAGQPDRAASVYEQALARRRVRLPADHPDVLANIATLAARYEALSQYAKAEALRREAVEKTGKQPGEPSAQAADALNALGVNLLQQRKWADAEAAFQNCLAVRERKQPDDWRTFSTRTQIGIALLRQEKYADAEPLLRTGYEGMRQRAAKIPAPGKARRLAAAVEPLVELYDAWGKRDHADEWRKKLEAHRDAEKQTEKPKER